jgi:xylan 1,4-beta-xylosidase
MKKNHTVIFFFLLAVASYFSMVSAASYTLSVDADQKKGSWNKFYEKAVACDHMYTVISSAYGRNISNALKKAHDEAGFEYVRGHGILDDDVAVYSETNGTAVYSWTNLDKIYDSVVAAGMRPIVEISFMPGALASSSTAITNVWYNNYPGISCAPKDWTKWKDLIKALIAHLEERYGKEEVENNWFFELWNEPAWMYSCGGGDDGYIYLYDSTSVAIKAQDSLIKLGGPAESGGASSSAITSLLRYKKTMKYKVDFISYHRYANDDNTNYLSASVVNEFHKGIVDLCKSYSFSGLILNTEYGPSYTQGKWIHDNEMAASFAAKMIYLLNSNDTSSYPPPYSFGWWALSDIYEETDNRSASCAFSGCYGLLTRGDSSISQSWDVPKPAFNAFKLLHRLNTYKISCTGGTTSSPGVNAIATISENQDTVSVLVFNQEDDSLGNSATSDNVSLTISNIPFTKAKIEHWVVDKTHSNSFQTWVSLGKPSSPTSAQWTTIANAGALAHYDSVITDTTLSSGTYSKSFTQNYYSVGLIQIVNTNGSAIRQSKNYGSMKMQKISIKSDRRNIYLSIPDADDYSVKLFTTDGRIAASTKISGSGTHAIPMFKVANGTYMLECRGQSQRILKPIIIGK